MLFNSFKYIIFLPVVSLIYYLLPHKYRWIFLLVASYYFYMNWNASYAILIFVSTLITWLCGILLEKEQKREKRRLYLTISLVINLSILFFFKYFDFLNTAISNWLAAVNLKWNVPNLNVLLPVGISFYTFQALGYTIDVYRKKIHAEKHFGIYALFVSFFPQLVAGPIERASNLLPQFHKKIDFKLDNLVEGIKILVWGYFLKVVVADRLALYVDSVYNNVDMHSGATLAFATFLFTFQVYGDFCGYSLIAIGSARILGFNLMTNFNRPLLASSITEFWRRWHISLSTWFKDYLYIPLGGSQKGKIVNYLNILLVFVVSGIWHGASFTYLFWGLAHGIFLCIEKFLNLHKLFQKKPLNIIGILYAFSVFTFSMIFFRANSDPDIIKILNKIFYSFGSIKLLEINVFVYATIFLPLLFIKEFKDEWFPGKLKLFSNKNPFIAALSVSLMIILILLIGVFDGGQFVYFQF